MKCNIDELKKQLGYYIVKNQEQVITPYIMGFPGIGKSQIVREFAEERGMKLIDLRLSQCLETDLIGILREDKHEASFCEWKAPINIPWEHNPQFQNTSGILFLDEINQAPEEVLKACFQLVFDHKVGANKLNKNWYIVAAGNLGAEDGNDGLTEFSSALKDRLCIIEIDKSSCARSWFTYARSKNLNKTVIAFLEKSPEYLYHETVVNGEKVFVTPRRWEKFCDVHAQQDNMDLAECVNEVGKFMLYDCSAKLLRYIEENAVLKAEDILYHWSKVEKQVLEKKEKSEEEILSVSLALSAWIADHFEKTFETNKKGEQVSLGYMLPKETKKVRDNLFAFMSLLRDDHLYNFLQDITQKAGVRCYNFLNDRLGSEHEEFFKTRVVNNIPKENRPPEDFNLKKEFKPVWDNRVKIMETAKAELEKRMGKKLTDEDIEEMVRKEFPNVKF